METIFINYLISYFNMSWFYKLLFLWILLGLFTFIYLIFSKTIAPYGRHSNSKWGIMIDNRWGWFWMELPALLLMPVIVLISPIEKNLIIILMLSLWVLHYFYRTILFPIKLRTKGKKIPIAIVISAFIFNLFNGFFIGYEIGYLSEKYSFGINTIIGVIIFFMGMYINRLSDNKLISLRKESQDYQIPKGGMFNYISCPNHFGEIVEWFGYSVIVYNLGALSFALWTAFNLIPRSLNHHNWYKKSFVEYPTNRKAVIPYII